MAQTTDCRSGISRHGRPDRTAVETRGGDGPLDATLAAISRSDWREMTYTIAGRDPATGQVGLATASNSANLRGNVRGRAPRDGGGGARGRAGVQRPARRAAGRAAAR